MGFEKPTTMDGFKDAITTAGDKKVVVQFSAEWCGACKQIQDDLDKLSVEFEGKINFVYVDCDELEDLQEVFGVTNMPTFLVFQGPGAPIDKVEGAKVENIRGLIEKHAA